MTLEKLIDTLREDFGCSLKSEKIIYYVNNLEKTLYNEGLISSPQSFSPLNAAEISLSLSSEHSEVYIYHILSREALLKDDIDRLNNFSTLFATAIGQVPRVDFTAAKFKNVW